MQTQASVVNPIRQIQSIPVMPSVPIMQSSNVILNSSTNMLYSSPPMPSRVSIPGFAFPEMAGYQQNMMMPGIVDTDRLPIDASFSPMSTKIFCPRCGQAVMTNVQL